MKEIALLSLHCYYLMHHNSSNRNIAGIHKHLITILCYITCYMLQGEQSLQSDSLDSRIKEPMKIIHKEQDIITAFAINQVRLDIVWCKDSDFC